MKDHDLNFLELVQSSLKNVEECDIYEVNEMLEKNREFYLIDVREDREWVQGFITGATHLGKGIIERDISSVVTDKDELIVLYCQGGFRSVLAAKNLKIMGYKNVKSMSGGLSEWVNNDFAVDKPQ